MRLLILSLYCLFTLFSQSLAAQTLTIVYSGNLDGELEPCGCTIDTDYGGILRRATTLEGLRQENADLVLISSGGLFATALGGDTIKNNFILSGLTQLNYDAVGVQWADLALGADFIAQSDLPFSAVNWQLGNTDQIPLKRIIQRGQQQLFFTQWLNPTTSPYKDMTSLSPINDNVSNVNQQFAKAHKDGMLTILGTTLTEQQASNLFDLSKVDILIIGSAYEQFGTPKNLEHNKSAKTLILQPGSRGQRLGQLQLKLDENGAISEWNHQVIELTNDISDAPYLADWYKGYNKALREAYEQEVKLLQLQDSGESPYVGEAVCKSCHQPAHQVWNGTDHAKAFADLEQVGKEFDPHCVACHTLGYQKPGGFLSIDLTPELANVQCENCHGAGRDHVNAVGQQKTPNSEWAPQQICSQCHIPKHSPKFKVKDYWPKILHSGVRIPKAE